MLLLLYYLLLLMLFCYLLLQFEINNQKYILFHAINDKFRPCKIINSKIAGSYKDCYYQCLHMIPNYYNYSFSLTIVCATCDYIFKCDALQACRLHDSAIYARPNPLRGWIQLYRVIKYFLLFNCYYLYFFLIYWTYIFI